MRLTLLTILLIFSVNEAFAVTCERYRLDTSGFKTKAAAESYYPKTLNLNVYDFVPKGGNSKQMRIDTANTEIRTGLSHRMIFSLLPNGKLIAALQGRSGYKPPGQAKYKCDLNAIEVREVLENKPAPEKTKVQDTSTASKTEDSTSAKCTSLALQNCSDEELCGMATRKENNLVVWETRGSFGKYANEAKKRSLDCGVASSQSINSNTKIENAEKKCTEIGYTKGTEKYADCVMKLM